MGTSQIRKTIDHGATAGALAVGPMTLFMFAAQNRLPASEKSPLPPATLTNDALEPTRFDRLVTSLGKTDIAMSAHFLFSMASGTAYGMIRRRVNYNSSRASIGIGILFGLAVWSISYGVWIPLLKFRASAYSMPSRRNLLMIGAHVVWGMSLGYAENELSQREGQLLDGSRKAPYAE